MCKQSSNSIDIPCIQTSIVHHKRKNAGLSEAGGIQHAGWLSERP